LGRNKGRKVSRQADYQVIITRTVYDSEFDELVEVPIWCECKRPAIMLSPALLGCEHCDTVCTDANCEDCQKFNRRFGAGL
jgi:hypothetical protein